MSATSPEPATVPLPDEPIVVHWRPGCGFCSALVRGLERHGLEFARANIWEDEDAAAFVRSVADGNEVVPTVRIGDAALVNPSALDVLHEVRERVPERFPADLELPQPSGIGRTLRRLLGG